jgi:hypothetical protein
MQNAIPLRRALIAVAAVAAFGIQIASAAAQAERDAQSTAQEAIRRLDLQTEVTREPEPFRIRLPPELLWVIIAVALGAVLYSFRDMIPLLSTNPSPTR